MQQASIKLAVTLGIASAIKYGMGHITKSRPCHEIVDEFQKVKNAYPSLCIEISQIGKLEQDSKFRNIMRTLERIVDSEKEEQKGTEFKIARLIGILEADLNDIVNETQAWKSDRLFNEKRIAIEDTVPTVRSQVENILHNHILSKCSRK